MTKLHIKIIAFATCAIVCFPSYKTAENTVCNKKEKNKIDALKNIVGPKKEAPEQLYEIEKKKLEDEKIRLHKQYRRTKLRKKFKHLAIGTAFGLTGLGVGLLIIAAVIADALASGVLRY